MALAVSHYLIIKHIQEVCNRVVTTRIPIERGWNEPFLVFWLCVLQRIFTSRFLAANRRGGPADPCPRLEEEYDESIRTQKISGNL